VADRLISRVALGPMRRGLRFARWHAGQCPGDVSTGKLYGVAHFLLHAAGEHAGAKTPETSPLFHYAVVYGGATRNACPVPSSSAVRMRGAS
jgi:hypothetical protein